MILYKSLYDRLRNQHESIDSIISNIDSNRLMLKPQEDKWSIHDNIAHLGRYQHLFLERINAILNTSQPMFDRYKAEHDPDFKKWQNLSNEDLILTLKKDRKNIFSFLTSLTEKKLNRTGHHKKFGTLTIIQWTEFFILHEAHHIYTIFQLAHEKDVK